MIVLVVPTTASTEMGRDWAESEVEASTTKKKLRKRRETMSREALGQGRIIFTVIPHMAFIIIFQS